MKDQDKTREQLIVELEQRVQQRAAELTKANEELARLLDGTCNIKSKPGKGTFIAVELPVAERESEP